MKREDLEIRVASAVNMERRADGAIGVTGYAAVFGEIADIGGMFRETIRAGAFRNVLNDDVRLLLEHRDLPLARTASGTLKLVEDRKGLRIDADLDAEDPDVKRIVPKMKRGDLNQMSIGFSMRGGVQEWDDSDEENPLRTIVEVGELLDASIVTFPAFPSTEIALRSLQQERASVSSNIMRTMDMDLDLRIRKARRRNPAASQA
ncbi:HK97 family phage prohead protease [Hyphococcus flavus]|uniref:HK97 family phage prohead protease n=1 Tax=Hyphococcus flavus TaxID=1866326 RepID=A0AAF0CBQ6_9PROT|nr:HK97 family phage prohead protease [Hyphococcus flavus]WDI31600.1 HK97 family phage prohead protease [Hyphococcus flavus]